MVLLFRRVAWSACVALMSALLLSGCCDCEPILKPVLEDRCQESEECSKDGLCSMRTHHAGDWFYRCYAGSRGDCKASKKCEEEGRCYPTEKGTCVRKEEVSKHRCAISYQCKQRGACASEDGFCVAKTQKHCRSSLRCKAQGRCGLSSKNWTCFATRDKHCEASTGCEIDGLCVRKGGLCTLEKGADACEESMVCNRYGRCERRPNSGCDPTGETPCGLFYCGVADESGPTPCTQNLERNFKVCSPDGRCVLDEDETCVRVP